MWSHLHCIRIRNIGHGLWVVLSPLQITISDEPLHTRTHITNFDLKFAKLHPIMEAAVSTSLDNLQEKRTPHSDCPQSNMTTYLQGQTVNSQLFVFLHNPDDTGIHDGSSPFKDVSQVHNPFRPCMACRLVPIHHLHLMECNHIGRLLPSSLHLEIFIDSENATWFERSVHKGAVCCLVLRRRGGAKIVGVDKNILSLGRKSQQGMAEVSICNQSGVMESPHRESLGRDDIHTLTAVDVH